MICSVWSRAEPLNASRGGAGRPTPQAPAKSASTATPCRRWLILLITFFALSWQIAVASTHFHSADAHSRTIERALTSVPSGTPREPVDAPADCPICHELAHSNLYLPTDTIEIAAPLLVFVVPAGERATAFALERDRVGWCSRAPPYSLQT